MVGAIMLRCLLPHIDWAIAGRGLYSLTVQLNLSRFGHTSPCPPV